MDTTSQDRHIRRSQTGEQGEDGGTFLLVGSLAAHDVVSDLQALGYAVAEARDGGDAATLLDAGDCAAVVVEVEALEGGAALRRLRDAAPDAPLIVAADAGRIADALDATGQGADLHIRKPLHARELVELARQGRKRRRLERENRKLTAELAHSDANYRSLIDTAPAAVLIHCDGRIVLANPSACALLGAASPQDLIGRAIMDIIHPDFHDVAADRMRDVLSGNPVRLLEQRLVRVDGGTVPVEVVSAKVTWQGRPGVQAVIYDISDRKRSQEALWMRARTIDQIKDCIFTADFDGRITTWNKGAEQMFGYGADEMTGGDICTIFPEKTPDRLHAAIIGPLLADGGLEREVKAQKATGEVFDALMSVSPLRDSMGRPVGMIGYLTDISARKRAEARLVASEHRLRSVVETAVDGIVVSDGRGRIQFANKAVESMFGHRAEDLIGKNVTIFMPEPFRSEHDGYIEQFVETGQSKVMGRGRDLVGMRADGSTFPIAVSLSSWVENGERRFTTLLRDISQRVETQKALEAARDRAEAADRAKTVFLAHMSHELRTPLNAVIGYSEMIMNQVLGPITPPRYAEYAKDVHASGTHLLKILVDILDMSKAVSGELTLDEDEIEVAELVDSCLRKFAHSADEGPGAIDLKADIEKNLPRVRVDGQRLGQAILSLLDNAARHTPANGRIVVAARRMEDGGVRLSISDTGPGIAADRIPTLLTPFGSTERAFIRSDGGLGLGLPLVKSFIELHDGEIRVDSAPGRGTQVDLLLPQTRLVA